MKRLPILLFTAAQTLFANTPQKPDISVGTFWESKYVSEGRDNLGDGGLVSLEAAVEWTNVALATWLVDGTKVNYQELQFTAEYRNVVDDVEFYTGYTRLQFPSDEAGDNELTAGLAYAGLPQVLPAIDYVFSTGASGGFLEISVNSEQYLLDDLCIVAPYLLQGFDFGYAGEESSGASNFQLGIDFALPFNKHFGFAASLAHSIAMKDVEKAGQGNVSWFTIGLTGMF